MMTRLLKVLLITFVCILSNCAEMFASTPYTRITRIIMVEETYEMEYLECDVDPVIKDGHTLVPIRAIAEKLEFNVDWDETTQKVTISKDEKRLEMHIGSTEVIKNFQSENMPKAPEVVEGRTMIPLRYTAEFFGRYVEWCENKTNNEYSDWISEEERRNLEANFIWISALNLLKNEDVNVPLAFLNLVT